MRALAVVATLWLAACPNPPVTDDAGEVLCNPNLPPASVPCLEGQCGNELGVGQPCTPGGNECGDLGLGNAIICSADFSDKDEHFCTLGCDADEQCGSDAYCGADPDDPEAGRGCVPESCRPEDG